MPLHVHGMELGNTLKWTSRLLDSGSPCDSIRDTLLCDVRSWYAWLLMMCGNLHSDALALREQDGVELVIFLLKWETPSRLEEM